MILRYLRHTALPITLLILLVVAFTTQGKFLKPSSVAPPAERPGNVMVRESAETIVTQVPQSPRPAMEAKAAEVKSPSTAEFARLIQQLSEPGGYFDTDNLISNETSYLHVMAGLRKLQVQGGAYIGVGPDQNFSYIAQIRPRLAFIVDIRRDNLLQHLLFKALFEESANRLEYLCRLFGRPVPANVREWSGKPVLEIATYLDKTPMDAEAFASADKSLLARINSYGLKLRPEETETISRIHSTFAKSGLALRFTSHGRSPRYYYPTYRDLMLEKDLTGKQCNYLVSEGDFQIIREMQQQHRIIPVVGNLAGNHALAAIARLLNERGEKVSAFYTSNVEYYLMRDDSFGNYAASVQKLPRDSRSVIIRSYFGGTWGSPLPQTVSGYYSTQLFQTMDSFVKEQTSGGYQSYGDLVSKHNLEMK
jgi:hypothetical protein